MCVKEVQDHERVHRFAMQQKAIEALWRRPENRCFSHVFRHALYWCLYGSQLFMKYVMQSGWEAVGKKEMEHEGSCS